MKYVHLIFSTGTPHLVNNLIKLLVSMSKIFICLILEEVTDVFHIGDFKVEFHSSIHKWLKLIGHYLQNGVDLNTKESKNGGSERLLKDWTCCLKKFCGERRKLFPMVWAQNKNLGLKSFNKKHKLWFLMSNWRNHQQLSLTTLHQLKKLIISERFSHKFMEMRDKQCYHIIGFLNGTKMDNSLLDMLIHLPGLLKFTIKNDMYLFMKLL